ncbi:MAG: cell division protein FtsQ/DivIB [Acidimicrobiales bacterium]
MHPLMRARWTSARRQEGRRRLRVVVALAVTLTAAAAGVAALESPVFAATHVGVHGAAHYSARQVEATAGLLAHPAMISLDPAAIERRLDRLPWVLRATVARQWPDSVDVAVVERTAVAQVADGSPGQMAVIDQTGRVLALEPGRQPGLPGLAGSASGAPAPGAAAATVVPGGRAPVPTSLLALCAALGDLSAPSGGAGLAQLHEGAGGPGAGSAIEGTLSGPAGARNVTVVFGNADQLVGKVQALASIVAQVPLGGVATIDLSAPDRPVLTSVASPGNVSSVAGG